MAFSIVQLPKVIPEVWKKSAFHTTSTVLWISALLSVAAAVFQIIVIGSGYTPAEIVGSIIVCVAAVGYVLLREKRVDMEISYEEC